MSLELALVASSTEVGTSSEPFEAAKEVAEAAHAAGPPGLEGMHMDTGAGAKSANSRPAPSAAPAAAAGGAAVPAPVSAAAGEGAPDGWPASWPRTGLRRLRTPPA